MSEKKKKIIETIKAQDIDRDGNNDNFYVLLDKINEIIEEVNKEASE